MLAMDTHCGQKARRSALHSNKFEDPGCVVVQTVGAGKLVEQEQTDGLVRVSHASLKMSSLKTSQTYQEEALEVALVCEDILKDNPIAVS